MHQDTRVVEQQSRVEKSRDDSTKQLSTVQMNSTKVQNPRRYGGAHSA